MKWKIGLKSFLRNEKMPYKISVRKLVRKCNPYKEIILDAAFYTPITKKEIRREIKLGNLIPPGTRTDRKLINHIRCIAWFVVNWSRQYPIEVDFEYSAFYDKDVSVDNGNHRLAAAMFRDEPWILAGAIGKTSEIKKYKIGK